MGGGNGTLHSIKTTTSMCSEAAIHKNTGHNRRTYQFEKMHERGVREEDFKLTEVITRQPRSNA